MPGNPNHVSLEPEAQAFVDATSEHPFLFELAPADGRAAVDGVQDSDIWKPEIIDEWIEIEGGPTGTVKVRIVRPAGTADHILPVIVYTHGAGWVFGDAHTHDRLVRDLAVGANAAVVFPEYDRSPEVHYPVANEQSYAAVQWVTTLGSSKNLDPTRIAIAGDSVGGNMAIALTLMAKERGDVSFVFQVLFYPVTDASFDTESYKKYATGYFLASEGMKWFWNQYTTSETDRAEITASPLRASKEQLSGLPPALIINGAADVLHDDGMLFADKLREAGVPVTHVTYSAIIHDFVMVNSMHDTHAAKAAIAQAVAALTHALHA